MAATLALEALVSKGQNFGFKLRPRMDTGANGREERRQNGDMADTISARGRHSHTRYGVPNFR